jgi:hypothetical protein
MTGLDNMKIDGLSKTIIIATSQTICQIKKCYQTRVFPNHAIYGYRGYRGIRVSSLYRRIPPISLYETLNVSNNGTGGRGRNIGGYIKRYQTFLLAYIRHMKDMRLYGLMV